MNQLTTLDNFTLNGKTILITGASSGIGRRTAIMAANSGARLILTGRDENRLKETIRMIREQKESAEPDNASGHLEDPIAIAADLLTESAIDDLAGRAPVLNGIVHSAGIVGPLPVKFIRQADIDRMFGINYHVPVNLTGKILRNKKLANGASLVFLSTIATRNPYFGGALYSGSKAALEAYSKTLALELASRAIRSNCIRAGLVDTPMIENPSEAGMQEEALKRYLSRYPLGIGSPADVASAILYFLSDASRWVTGTSLILGGE